MKDELGATFGRLTVISRAENTKGGSARWRCRCACGGEAISLGANLRRGNTTSCGCVHRELAAVRGARAGASTRTHGHAVARTREYYTWSAMLQRCQNPAQSNFENYGARGITVCDRWKSFENFLADMGPKPPGTSIEREDNDKGYSPDNCRWATGIEQNNNRRVNKQVIYRGMPMTIPDAVRRAGSVVSTGIARQRINRDGWAIEKAVECAAG